MRLSKNPVTVIEMRSVLSHRRAPAAYAVRRCRLPRSRAATSKRALARIQRLCCLGIGSEMLMPDLMREVMRLVPSRHGQFCWAGANAEIANFYGTFPRSVMELFLKEFYRTRLEKADVDASASTQANPALRQPRVSAQGLQ